MTNADTGPSKDAATASVDALAEVARGYEPERYLAATLAPLQKRPALLAIAAYAADLRRIAATASQPMLGEIRLQWWRDALDTIAKGNRIGSPLADALGEAIRTFALPVPMLVAMSEARAWDLYDDPMPDAAALAGYLAKTEALPFELALRLLDVPAGDAGALAMTAGRAYGLTRLAATLSEKLAAGGSPLPVTVLAKFDLTPETSMGAVNASARVALQAHLCSEIERDLQALRPQFTALTRRQRTALLPLAAVPPYLRGIARQRGERLRDNVELAPFTRVWRIALAHVTGRI